MKVALLNYHPTTNKKLRGTGLGELMYLSAMSLLGNKGLSPHRRNGSSRQDSQNVWVRLSNKDYIDRIDLDIKLYDNKPILDSKYILIDDNMKNNILKRIKKISFDAYNGEKTSNKSNIFSKQAWEIVNKEMDNE